MGTFSLPTEFRSCSSLLLNQIQLPSLWSLLLKTIDSHNISTLTVNIWIRKWKTKQIKSIKYYKTNLSCRSVYPWSTLHRVDISTLLYRLWWTYHYTWIQLHLQLSYSTSLWNHCRVATVSCTFLLEQNNQVKMFSKSIKVDRKASYMRSGIKNRDPLKGNEYGHEEWCERIIDFYSFFYNHCFTIFNIATGGG